MSVKGGEHAYKSRLGKDRSPSHSRHSIASAKWPPRQPLSFPSQQASGAACQRICCRNSGRYRANNGLLISATGVAACKPHGETVGIEPSLGEVDAFQGCERAARVGRLKYRVVPKSG